MPGAVCAGSRSFHELVSRQAGDAVKLVPAPLSLSPLKH